MLEIAMQKKQGVEVGLVANTEWTEGIGVDSTLWKNILSKSFHLSEYLPSDNITKFRQFLCRLLQPLTDYTIVDFNYSLKKEHDKNLKWFRQTKEAEFRGLLPYLIHEKGLAPALKDIFKDSDVCKIESVDKQRAHYKTKLFKMDTDDVYFRAYAARAFYPKVEFIPRYIFSVVNQQHGYVDI